MSAQRDPDGPEPDGIDPVDWSRLPDAVRARLADVAAAAVGGMPATEVPVPLRRLARFTPAKRAKLGGPALTAELTTSRVFRTAVVAWWAEHRPGELSTDVDDPLTAAAAAVLVGHAAAADVVAAAAHRGDVGELRAERDAALSRVDKLSTELERLRGELGEAREQARTAGERRDAEYQQLRRRVSEQGAKLRAALDGGTAADRTVEQLRGESEAALVAARAEVEKERARAEQERRRADRGAAAVAPPRHAARQ
ncbi:MAG: RNA-binding protein, partial [Pseudonocardia sp.]|nr:RNA-binding protein [Pseudonocardia sp.]